MDKVLVTGASGFIGSHLLEGLVREGYAVRALVRYTSNVHHGNLDMLPADVIESVELCPADLRDGDAVKSALQGIDTVYHLGAINSNPYSIEHPEETMAVNVTGTLNVLQAMRHNNTRRGVIISSSEVYGAAQYVPIDEKHPLQPQSPYSASKISAEALSLSFHRSYQTPLVVIRPFNAYGPRQSARAVIPTIISQALTKDVVSLGAVHTVRDYTYVTDVIRAMMLAGQSDRAIGQIVNLGSGHGVTIGDIAAKIIALIGRPVTIAANEDRRLRLEVTSALHTAADNLLAASLLDWQPQITLADGLQLTIDWIAAHLEQFNPDSYQL